MGNDREWQEWQEWTMKRKVTHWKTKVTEKSDWKKVTEKWLKNEYDKLTKNYKLINYFFLFFIWLWFFIFYFDFLTFYILYSTVNNNKKFK